MYRFFAAVQCVVSQIKSQIVKLKLIENHIALSAGHSSHPRQQLVRGERLCKIIVGAAVKTADLIGYFVARRKQDDRSVNAALTQLLYHLESVKLGQHDIKDYYVVYS